jgi:hypothetical protein
MIPDAVVAAEATAGIEGWLDFVSATRAFGWARDAADPETVLEVELRLPDGGAPLAVARAERLREDLRANGVGDGRCGFDVRLEMPEGADPKAVVAVARSPRTGAEAQLRRSGDRSAARPDAELSRGLQQIAQGLGRLRQEQLERLDAIHGSVMQAVRDGARTGGGAQAAEAAARSAADLRDGMDALAASVEGTRASVEAAQERIAAVEVFLVRIDGTLRGLDERARDGAATTGRPALRAALTLLGLAAAAGAGACLQALFG